MKVRIKQDRSCACFRGPHKVHEGSFVVAVAASNQPDYLEKGLLWVAPPDCPEECYGILLDKQDYSHNS